MSGWRYDPEDAKRCWKAGEYQGHIEDCEYGQSKNGNDMATVKVRVYDGDRSIVVRDWIVNHPDMLWKLKHLASACGREAEFKAGEFEPHYAVNEPMTVVLSEDDDPKYGEQNRVSDYKPKASGAVTPKARDKPSVPDSTIPNDSDIPF